MRTLLAFSLLAALLAFLPTTVIADDPPDNDADWLTWTLKDVSGNNVDLSNHQNHVVFVFLFRPDNEDSCKSIRTASAYVREHPNHANRVLAMCCDDGGAVAIKLFLRQEEYSKRVAAWEAEQEAARQAAEQAEEEWTPTAMPDFVKQIEDELADPEDLATMVAHHLPFSTCQRCEEMWTWLLQRMEKPEGLPRILKINGQGRFLHEWTEVPTNPNPLSGN